MLRVHYPPTNLFREYPALGLALDPVLAQLDHLLDDDALIQQVRGDLANRHPLTTRRGRSSTPVEVVLRLLVVKRLYRWSYEETERFVADSLVLRQFCRVYLRRVPDDTTLRRWANRLTPATLARLNDRVVELARSVQLTRGRTRRVDRTVVATTIPHPTDSRRLGDGVRVLRRRLRRATGRIGQGAGLAKGACRSRTRSVRRLAQQLHRVARRQGEAAAEDLRQAYGKLIAIAQATRRQAQRVKGALQAQGVAQAQRLREQFEHVLPLMDQAIDQATRRVLDGEAVPAGEKLLSLVEPHTQLIQRHKAGKPVEFGRKVMLDEVEGGIISGFAVLTDTGLDHPQVKASLAGQQRRFGRAPDLLAGDRGCFSPTNEDLARQAGVKRVVLPKTGRVSAERQRHERQRWFRRGFRFRAGVEGRISVLKRGYELDRCRDHGAAGMGRWVGWGVVTANLATIARTVAARPVGAAVRQPARRTRPAA
jgi:transposase, IS5 family